MKHQTIIKATMLTVVLAIASSCEKGIEFTYIEEEAIVQDVTTSVTATGTIEPVTSVDVGTQVSGIVSKLYVDYNSVVKAGDVIVKADGKEVKTNAELNNRIDIIMKKINPS